MSEITRYKEGYDPNHAQECLCNRRPMSTGLVVDKDGDYVDYEDYQKLEQEVKDLKARVREFELLLKNQHKLKEENLEMKAFLGGKGFTVDSVDGSLAQLEQEVKELKARNQILSRLKVIGTVALKRVDLPLNKALAQHDREVIQRVKDSILNHELTKYGGSLSDALYVIDEQLQEQGNNE